MTDIELCRESFDKGIEQEKRRIDRKRHRELQGYEFKPEYQREIKRNQIAFPARYNPKRGMMI
jgi:hypothetical protein